MKYHSIYLLGFRATGKSTIGPLLAKRLKWKFVEMDRELEKSAGKTIPELTSNGIKWLQFRSLEHELLKNLLLKKNIIVSTGGGLAVNDMPNENAKKTFGELNKKLLIKDEKNFIVLLTADEKVIETRIRKMEIKSKTTLRPMLNTQKATKVNARIKNLNELEKRRILRKEIINDSMKLYKQRKSLYEKLTAFSLDTGSLSINQVVEQIVQAFYATPGVV